MSNSQYLYYLNYVQNSVIYYTVLATLPIGILGNILSMYVYTRPKLNRKTNTGFLYKWLCAFNLILILYFTFVFQSFEIFGYTISLPCGLNTYLVRVVWCIVPWMQTIICFDRFVMIVFPQRKKTMSQKWVLFLTILGTLVLIFVANMANLLSYPTTANLLGQAFSHCAISTAASVAASIMGMIMRVYIPFGIMILLNVIVFKRLRVNNTKVGVKYQISVGQLKRKSDELERREHRFIVSTLFIDLTFFIYYTPIAVFIAISVASMFNSSLLPDPLSNTLFNLFIHVSHLLVYLYSVSILFIFAFFNRYFRDELVRTLRLNVLFPNCGKRNRLTTIGSITNNTRF